jgi:ferredoxin-NADP reductase
MTRYARGVGERIGPTVAMVREVFSDSRRTNVWLNACRSQDPIPFNNGMNIVSERLRHLRFITDS